MRLPRVGAHLSSSGGAEAVLARARRVGAQAVQLFSSNPRQWPIHRSDPTDARLLGLTLRRARIPLYVHSIYLINLASPDEELRRRSSLALADALLFAWAAGAAAVVTHLGSRRGSSPESGRARVVASIADAYGAAEEMVGCSPALLLEVSAGAGDTVGATLEELCEVHSLLRREFPQVGLCLDTAHLLAAGYPVHTEIGVQSVLQEIDERSGVGAVGLVHLNDSRTGLGSRRDRHENLGEGVLGLEGVALWVRQPALRSVPFVLEVPGFDGKGPDPRNLRRAKRLRRDPDAAWKS